MEETKGNEVAKLNRAFKAALKEMGDEYVLTDEFAQIFELVVGIVNESKEDADERVESVRNEFRTLKEMNEAEWQSLKQEISQIIQGKDGKDGKDGRDGIDGEDGKDGKNGEQGKQGEPGKDGSPDTPDQVIEKVNTSKKFIKKERIEGLDDIERIARANAHNGAPLGTSKTEVEALRKRIDTLSVGGGAVDSVNGATGVVVLDTDDISEGTNKYFSNAQARAAISLTTTGTSGAATYNSTTGVLNVPQYSAGSGGISRTVTVSSGAFTAGASDSTDYVYLVAGAHAVALPTAASNTNRYTFKNNHSAAITITPDGAETIDGAASIQIAPEDSVDLISTGSNWSVI